jgi:hypothetical protein
LGFVLGIGLGGQDRVVTGGVMTEDEFGFWGGLDTEALGGDGDAAIVGDFDDGAFTPDEGPPGTARDGAQDGAFLFFGGVPGLLGFHLEFAMEFMLIAMEAQGGEVRIGLSEIGNVFAGEVGGEAILPVLVFAFDFAFGLGCGCVAETHAIEAQGLAELGEGVGDVGEEEGVEVHVEFEGQAAFAKGGGEEVVISQEVFVLVEFGAGEETAAIIEHIEHGEKSFAGREPAVGRGIELPEFADLGALPAADGSGDGGVGFWVSQMVGDGPVADLGAIDFEITEAQEFAGHEAVIGGGRGGEAFAEQREDVGGPEGGVIAAGGAGRPEGFLLVGAGAEIVGVEFMEAAARKPEFARGAAGVELLGAEGGQHMTDQRGGETMSELLLFFIVRVWTSRTRLSCGRLDLSHWH